MGRAGCVKQTSSSVYKHLKSQKSRAPHIFETRQIDIFNFNSTAILSMHQLNYIVIKITQKDLCKILKTWKLKSVK